jgi:hypothetical protein
MLIWEARRFFFIVDTLVTSRYDTHLPDWRAMRWPWAVGVIAVDPP